MAASDYKQHGSLNGRNEMIVDNEKYTKEYDENKLWDKILHMPKNVSKEFTHKVVVLYVILTSQYTPLWVKLSIVAALGYFICPVDLIPDFIPFTGYLDDLAMLTFVIGEIAVYETVDVKARTKKIEEKLGINNK
jgi:uncharacterized membrane protein YkvA (DUF1232 family)